MNEAEAFRKALNEAGQPWSRRGVRIVGVGVLAMLVLQIAARSVPYAFYFLVLSVAVIAVGWIMLIIAVVNRRRWVKANPIGDVPLPPAPGPLPGAS